MKKRRENNYNKQRINNKQIKRKKKQTEVNIKKIDKKTSLIEREKRREKTKRGR